MILVEGIDQRLAEKKIGSVVGPKSSLLPECPGSQMTIEITDLFDLLPNL